MSHCGELGYCGSSVVDVAVRPFRGRQCRLPLIPPTQLSFSNGHLPRTNAILILSYSQFLPHWASHNSCKANPARQNADIRILATRNRLACAAGCD